MIGDTEDMAARLQGVLPARWFADDAPVLQAVLLGLGNAWASIYTLVQFVCLQTRIVTATGNFLDLVAADFFGTLLLRRTQETDTSFVKRIQQEIFRPRGTRLAVTLAVQQLTGRAPTIFEPARTTDTGGYAAGGIGYGVAGGWGNLNLPFQFFITAFRPLGGGIAEFAGYGTGGLPYYGDIAMVQTVVADNDIYDEISAVIPAATIAWSRITN